MAHLNRQVYQGIFCREKRGQSRTECWQQRAELEGWAVSSSWLQSTGTSLLHLPCTLFACRGHSWSSCICPNTLSLLFSRQSQILPHFSEPLKKRKSPVFTSLYTHSFRPHFPLPFQPPAHPGFRAVPLQLPYGDHSFPDSPSNAPSFSSPHLSLFICHVHNEAFLPFCY